MDGAIDGGMHDDPSNGAEVTRAGVPIPDVARATTVVQAPGSGPGFWAGAASAARHGGFWWLAYRIRRPLDRGRGIAVRLARSADGERFAVVGQVPSRRFGAASLERSALIARPDGGWRLYVSCATPNSKHWRVDALDADTVEELPLAEPVTVLPGDAAVGVKDPVVGHDDDGWWMWVCCHPLDVPGAEDRMTSRFLRSPDGLAWDWAGALLAPPEHGWARRGTRVTAVLPGGALLFDGRASAEENWSERTGLALPDGAGGYTIGDAPLAASPHALGALRYVSAIPLVEGGWRMFFEAARPDGAHDLMTQLVTPAIAP